MHDRNIRARYIGARDFRARCIHTRDIRARDIRARNVPSRHDIVLWVIVVPDETATENTRAGNHNPPWKISW